MVVFLVRFVFKTTQKKVPTKQTNNDKGLTHSVLIAMLSALHKPLAQRYYTQPLRDTRTRIPTKQGIHQGTWTKICEKGKSS